MIDIKRIEIYREFQKNILTLVQNEAIMCGCRWWRVTHGVEGYIHIVDMTKTKHKLRWVTD